MAGIFISIGGTGYLQAIKILPNAYGKILGSILFSIGLISVFIANAELFTGNSLMIVGKLEKIITTKQMFKNWIISYIGNLIGSILVAILIYSSKLNLSVENIILTKSSKEYLVLVVLGILCNLLVCLAVWMSYRCDSVVDKILISILPIFIFVICGFEHSIANMYYVVLNMLYNHNINGIGIIIPATIGNIIGGCFVGIMYYIINKEK